jgi:hypothetical protein
METIVFSVQGSAIEPYKVTFSNNIGKISASCTCQAAVNGLSCKHRLRILAGEKKDVVSDNLRSIETLLNWLPGSEIEQALIAVGEAEKIHDHAKKELEKAKKRLAKALTL